MKNRKIMYIILGIIFLTINLQPFSVMAKEQIVVKEIKHIHQGNEKEGGDCYQEAVLHKHEGDEKKGGGCYTEEVLHVHTGDETSGKGCFTQPVYHVHEGNDKEGGNCFQTPIYHKHSGNISNSGGCYNTPVYHRHNGNESAGGACYAPVFHNHEQTCYSEEQCHEEYIGGLQVLRTYTQYCYHHKETQHAEVYVNFLHSLCGIGTERSVVDVCWTCKNFDRYHSYQRLICGKAENVPERFNLICGKDSAAVDSWEINCAKTDSTVEGFEKSCKKTADRVDYYKQNCNKTDSDIDSYKMGCNKSESYVEKYNLSCVKDENTVYAQLFFHNMTPKWTAGNVILNAEIQDESGFLIIDEDAFRFQSEDGVIQHKAGEKNSASVEVTENGVYEVIFQIANADTDTEKFELSLRVKNIDKTQPMIEKIDVEKEGKKDISVNVEAADRQPDGSGGSGLAEKAFSYDGGKTWCADKSKILAGKSLNEEKIINIAVKDMCGNISNIKKDISYIIFENETEVEEPSEEETPEEETPEEETPEEEIPEEETPEEEVPKEETPEEEAPKEEPTGESGDREHNKEEKPSEKIPPIEEEPLKELEVTQVLETKKKNKIKKQDKFEKVNEKTETVSLEDKDKKNNQIKEIKETVPALSVSSKPKAQVQKELGTGGQAEKVIKAAALTIGSVSGIAAIIWLLYLMFFHARIYHNDGEGKYHYAGSCMILKEEDIFTVSIPQMIWEQSETGQYSIRTNKFFYKINAGRELLVTAGEHKETVWVDREISLRLPEYV